ncbi:MAG TPA: hypothetical protein DCM87_03220 [Planctomycetes bacterium]|nr:hypothetical protein [Planctomycetota bacterium]
MRSLCACAALVLAGCAAGPKEGYTFLFDGETLDGWQRHEKMPGGEWAVVDGAIAGKEGADASGGFLATTRTYKNFIIELDVCMDWPFDSGVFLRVGPDGKSHQVTLDYRPGGEIGGIYVPWGPGFVCHALPAYVCGDTPDSIEAFPEGEWNHVRIRIRGEPAHIQFWLNGTLVTDFQHSAATTDGIPPEGPICLQVHGGVENAGGAAVRFRNIQIKELL